jgi:hypothetical protein
MYGLSERSLWRSLRWAAELDEARRVGSGPRSAASRLAPARIWGRKAGAISPPEAAAAIKRLTVKPSKGHIESLRVGPPEACRSGASDHLGVVGGTRCSGTICGSRA